MRPVLRRWLWLVPAAFRERFGDAMEAAFEDRLREARGRSALAVAGLWTRTLVDLAWTGQLERVRHLASGVLRDDARVAVRGLVRRPVFAGTAMLTIALGIGAVTAVFSLVHGVLLQPLPVDAPGTLLRVWSRNETAGLDHYFVAPKDVLLMQRESETLAAIGAWYPQEANVATAPDADPVRVPTFAVTENLFDVLGVRAALGRTFLPEDAVPGGTGGVLLTWGAWHRLFGGTADVLSRELTFPGPNGGTVPILGVLPETLEWLTGDVDLVFPFVGLETSPSVADRFLSVVARMREGVPERAVTAELERFARAIGEAEPERAAAWAFDTAPLHEAVVGDVRGALLVLLGAAALVLLVACANVGGLMIGRAEARIREVALRSALGAGRARVIRLLVTESLLLTSLGALAGVALAGATLNGLVRAGAAELPRLEATLRVPVLFVAAALAIACGTLIGLVPALRIRRVDLSAMLREGGRSSTDGPETRLRGAFLVGQLALSVVLVAGAGLFVKSFVGLQRTDPGFATDVITAEVSLGTVAYPAPEDVAAFYEALRARAATIPGVESVALTTTVPFGLRFDYRAPLDAVDHPATDDAARPRPWWREVDEGFFETLGIDVLQGRAFTAEDRARSDGVVVVNQAAARLIWPDGDALGRELTGAARPFGPLGDVLIDRVRVIGVVRDIHYEDLATAAPPAVYFPFRQAPFRRMSLVLRTSVEPAVVIAALRRELRAIDPTRALSRVDRLDARVHRSLARERLSSGLVSAFATLALLLAAVGLYGSMSHAVARRASEIGVRRALGARPAHVLRIVLVRSAALTALGLALGLAGALAFGRILAGQLANVGPTDPVVLSGVVVTLAAVAAAASLAPAWRALRVDPAATLRQE